MGLANIELPKKVKYAPHKKKADGGSKMDLAGRTYADRLALPGDLKLLTVQIDCVEGLRRNVYCQALADKIGVMISTLSAFCVPTAFPTSEICQA